MEAKPSFEDSCDLEWLHGEKGGRHFCFRCGILLIFKMVETHKQSHTHGLGTCLFMALVLHLPLRKIREGEEWEQRGQYLDSNGGTVRGCIFSTVCFELWWLWNRLGRGWGDVVKLTS